MEEAIARTEHERELVLEAAHKHADEIQQRAQRRVADEGWELHRVKVERQRYLESFRALLLRELEELDKLSEGTANAPVKSEGRNTPPGFEAPPEASTA